jgi:hypothetical protein
MSSRPSHPSLPPWYALGMSNETIIQMMREVCDQWDAGASDCLDVGRQLVGLASAIEGHGHAIKDEAERFQFDIIVASESDDPIPEICEVVARTRKWIEGLPA